ncbi:MAG: nuiA [Pedosphaera sp.]|nr:nuiA [Pedosphaera sp.]
MLDDTIKSLQEATRDVLYMSESDYPFQIIQRAGEGRPPDAQTVLELSSRAGGAVQVVPLETFFKHLIAEKPWHREQENATVRKFQKLLQVIRQHLPNAQVFRVGEIQVDVFILGNTADGDLAGLSTRAIET